VPQGRLQADLGFVHGHPPNDPTFHHALDTELSAMAACLGVERN
jgi:hypothetical protein